MSNGMTNLKDNVKEVKEKGKKVLKTFTSKGGKDTQGPPLQPGRTPSLPGAHPGSGFFCSGHPVPVESLPPVV